MILNEILATLLPAVAENCDAIFHFKSAAILKVIYADSGDGCSYECVR